VLLPPSFARAAFVLLARLMAADAVPSQTHTQVALSE
jgi:hypothetical protein